MSELYGFPVATRLNTDRILRRTKHGTSSKALLLLRPVISPPRNHSLLATKTGVLSFWAHRRAAPHSLRHHRPGAESAHRTASLR